jgi:integrase
MVNQMAKRGENIYKRKDGRWEARAIKGYSEQGKAVYAYFYGRTYKEAKDKMFLSLPYVNTGVFSTTPNDKHSVLFETVLDEWLEQSRHRIKESSYIKYHNLIGKHIKPTLGMCALPSITSAAVNRLVAEKLKTEANSMRKGLSIKTVKDIVFIIKSTLRYGKSESLVSDFIINVTLPKDKPNNIRILSATEQGTLEKFLCADMDESKLGIYVCLYTGIRIGEICSALWSDFSLEDGMLVINRTMQRIQTLEDESSEKTKIITTDPKSNFSVRTIPLPDCLLDKLKQFRPTLQNTYLLTGESGRFIEPRTYQYRFKSYLAKCGIKDANFHALRHTFSTRCVALGFDIKSLSEILGHSNVNITLNRYVHPTFEMKRENMNKLEALH